MAVLLILFLNLLSFVFPAPGPSRVNFDSEKSGSANAGIELPSGYNSYFAGSGVCAFCHSSMVNSSGEPVSIAVDWRSSMMANASKDPFWRAKVSHETLVNPQHAEALEDVCTRCHAPMGHFNAHMTGQSQYSIAEMAADPLARDGASCTVCHQIKPESMGNYSGNILFGENKLIWGPYDNPFANPMINNSGYTPVKGDHIADSRLCGSCHTLLTNTVDLNGNLTGTQFVEQAVYHEWLNSDFPASGTSCQSCHIPRIPDPVVISSMPPWLGPRTPFGMHHLAGANAFMLRLLKDNLTALGITASQTHVDSTLSRALRMLQEQTLQLEVADAGRTADSLFVDVTLQNMAGHKFPSGYPSRRAFITLTVTAENGDIAFQSGTLDDEFNLTQEDEGYEPHYNIIDDEGKVQIYQMVMGDVNFEPTTILERAFMPLKDNRLPPAGFTSAHPSYDTVMIAGAATGDDDFNKVDGLEGSGKDMVHYHIPTYGYEGDLLITVEVYYQTVAGNWLEEMFAFSSDEIDAFKDYYEAADKEPVLVATDFFGSTFTGIGIPRQPVITFGPNPARDYLQINGLDHTREVHFYDLAGRLYTFPVIADDSGYGCLVKTPPVQGVVILKCNNVEGVPFSCKLIID